MKDIIRKKILLVIGCIFFMASGQAYGKDAIADILKQWQPGEITQEKLACEKALEKYRKARHPYVKKANAYWKLIKKKKRKRSNKKRKKQKILRTDYVLTHPPTYKGPLWPKCMDKKTKKPTKRKTIPTVSKFLAAAKKEYGYVPKKVKEKDFKKSYATEALSLGLKAEQVIGVYALETGGLGPYNRQSGIFNITQECKPIKPKGRAASTALGYAQLLAANTSAVLNENGAAFAKTLEINALLATGKRKKELLTKAKMLRRMIKDIRKGIKKYKRRNNWREFVAFGKTSKGLAIHTVNLDLDIGPKLQVYKLNKIINVAKRKGFSSISSAQLELMNLAGYGRGLAMMSSIGKTVPTSNFFSRGGYYRNPVVKSLTGDGLLKKLAKIISVKSKKCGSVEFAKIFKTVANKK